MLPSHITKLKTTKSSHADIQRARKLLNYEPSISLEEGLNELAGWAKTHGWGATDLFEKPLRELREKHLAA